MTVSTTDRIEKQALLHAPVARVWRAIADSAEFGQWFGARFEGPFAAGATIRGTIAETTVDPEVARHQAPYVGRPFEIIVERLEPERAFAFRWHPYAVDADADYSAEPTTLVTFTLEPVADGTQLTIVESGFDRLPAARRAAAFTANDGGWTMQVTLVARYVGHDA